jgi:two-component system chemotaxis sensor kinase CheA
MNKKQEEFLRELLADFMIEAAEHHQAIITGLLELEKDQDNESRQKLVEMTFREIHSLKGAARAVNLIDIEQLCQGLESVFSLLKQQAIDVSKLFFDTFHDALDLLEQYLDDLANQTKTASVDKAILILTQVQELCKGSVLPASTPLKAFGEKGVYTPIQLENDSSPTYKPIGFIDNAGQISRDLQRKKNELSEKVPKQVEQNTPTIDHSGAKDTVRISIAKLTELLIQAEELITSRSMLGYDLRELNRIGKQTGNKNKQLNVQDDQITTVNQDIQVLIKNMDQHYRILNRTVDDLLFNIKNTLLLPFSNGLDWLPKFIRDLSHDLKKEIRFSVKGDEMEIDRRILEKIKVPLIHLVRNCIDHGIETTEKRLNNHKPPFGNVSLTITQQNNREVTLTLRDDGAGINREKVLQKSIKAGLVSSEQALKMSDHEVYSLIFNSGISTSPFITDLSGHGLGLAIVAENVTLLGGSISVESEEQKGTTFTIRLPITLLTFRGILIRIAEHHFVIPTKSVDRVMRIKSSEIKTIENKAMINVDSVVIGVVWLSKVLELSSVSTLNFNNETFHALILNAGQQRMAFIVDAILDEQEGVIKTLGSQLVSVCNVSGATLLGNGRIVPILNASELIEASINASVSFVESVDSDEEEKPKQTVLVADDSITSRSLIRNIVESAGFKVKTAVDGFEAYKLLQEEYFELVISDVEMPRMNGFELTTKIRNDKNFSKLPVILVTALEQPSDKQRGMECGASAYIVKSSFEQSNLIEAIHRLI